MDIDEISSNPRKCLRDHEIRKSEDRDRRIATVLKEDFVNPFNDLPNIRNLYNLASGHPFPEEATEHLLSLEKQGQGLLSDFSKRLHLSEEQTSAFFDPISRVPWKEFCNADKKAKITAEGETKDVAVQRDILGLLVVVSSNEGAVVDLDKALSYTLSPVPLALATSDGIPCKSKLMDAALSSIVTDNVNTDHATCLVIDLIATIRCIAKVPSTFRELALQLLHQIPSMYQTVYAACDTYLERSIKSSEHEIRGQAETFVIRSPDIRIPPDFENFLNNGTNKERLLELIEDVWKGEAAALGNRVVCFTRQCTCVRLTSQRVETIEELRTNHEEADTKICIMQY